MLSVVTPAAGSRLTTEDRARDHLQLSAEVAASSYLLDLIDAASDAIARDCDRIFGRRVLRQRFGWPATGGGLRLAPGATGIVAVTEDGVTRPVGGYEIDAEDRRLYRLAEAGERIDWSAAATVVTYATGWVLPGDQAFGASAPADRLPASVEQACFTIVSARVAGRTRDPMLRSSSTEGAGSDSWIASAEMGGIPPQAAALIAPFRLWSVG